MTALAGSETQTAFDLREGARQWAFTFAWNDADHHRQEISFDLPAGAMAADKDEITWLPRKQLEEDVAAAIRAYGRGLHGVKLTVDTKGAGLRIDAKGTGDVRGALKGAEQVRDDAVADWLGDHAFTTLKDGSVTFDHAALVLEYADALRPVADALREGTPDDRAFVERALSFVQSIPYEARKRNGGDPGYRRPLALLARDRGDCDSKTVLFLGIVHAALPDLPLSVVYVPDHALAGVGLERSRGDDDFKVDGVRYLYAEPVGPAQSPLGVHGDHHAARKGEVHPVAG